MFSPQQTLTLILVTHLLSSLLSSIALSKLQLLTTFNVNIMPPKKDTAGAEANELLVGFADKETKLIAAAYLSCTGPDKVSARYLLLVQPSAGTCANNIHIVRL